MLGAMSVGRGTTGMSSSLNTSDHTPCRDEEAVSFERSGRSFSFLRDNRTFHEEVSCEDCMRHLAFSLIYFQLLSFTSDGQVAFLRGTLSPKQATL